MNLILKDMNIVSEKRPADTYEKNILLNDHPSYLPQPLKMKIYQKDTLLYRLEISFQGSFPLIVEYQYYYCSSN